MHCRKGQITPTNRARRPGKRWDAAGLWNTSIKTLGRRCQTVIVVDRCLPGCCRFLLLGRLSLLRTRFTLRWTLCAILPSQQNPFRLIPSEQRMACSIYIEKWLHLEMLIRIRSETPPSTAQWSLSRGHRYKREIMLSNSNGNGEYSKGNCNRNVTIETVRWLNNAEEEEDGKVKGWHAPNARSNTVMMTE